MIFNIYYSLFIIFMFLGCAQRNQSLFNSTEHSNDLSYGYSAQNPVLIKNKNLKNSLFSSYYYMSRLRTANGNKLDLIQRISVGNPNYKSPKLGFLTNGMADTTNYGNGPILDLYILSAENELDTIRIYVNPYVKGNVFIPNGLKFEKE